MSETVDVLKRRDPFSDVLDQRQDHNLATILGMERGIVPMTVTNLPPLGVAAQVEGIVRAPALGQVSLGIGGPLCVAHIDQSELLRRAVKDLALRPTEDRLRPAGPAVHAGRLARGI